MTEFTPDETRGARAAAETTIDAMVDGRAPESTTLFLAVAQVAMLGAACGGLAGFTILATLMVVTPGVPLMAAIPGGVLLGGTFGAAAGALLAPTLGFWLFRDVPLGYLAMRATIGTVAGGLLAALLGGAPAIGAFVGLALGLASTRFGAWAMRRA